MPWPGAISSASASPASTPLTRSTHMLEIETSAWPTSIRADCGVPPVAAVMSLTAPATFASSAAVPSPSRSGEG